MAQKNLINVSCASITEVFRHIKDFIGARSGIADYSTAGLGWTVHDSSYAGGNEDAPATDDWVVFKSSGENGKRSLYIRLLFSTLANGIVRHSSGLYWNASTNAWVSGLYSGQNVNCGPTTGSGWNLYIYGSLDHLYIIIGNGTALYGRAILIPEYPIHDDTVATTTSAVTAGTGVVVPVDAVPSSWAVGKAVYVASATAMEKNTITNISGLNVTMTLANNHASGARIARDMTIAMSYPSYFVGQLFINFSHEGTAAPSNYVSTVVNSTILTAADPDPSNNCHTTSRVRIAGTLTTPAGDFGATPRVLRVSPTGTTSGSVDADDATGDVYRLLSIMEGSTPTMYAFREV